MTDQLAPVLLTDTPNDGVNREPGCQLLCRRLDGRGGGVMQLGLTPDDQNRSPNAVTRFIRMKILGRCCS